MSGECDNLMAGVDVVPFEEQLQRANILGNISSGGPNIRKVIAGGSPSWVLECPGAEYARRSGSSASPFGMLSGGFLSGSVSRSL